MAKNRLPALEEMAEKVMPGSKPLPARPRAMRKREDEEKKEILLLN